MLCSAVRSRDVPKIKDVTDLELGQAVERGQLNGVRRAIMQFKAALLHDMRIALLHA